MAARTTISAVQGILGVNYNGKTPLGRFIETATMMVDHVKTMAATKEITLTDSELEIIERWLSAHYYCVNDPLYTSRSTGGSSGSFQRGTSGDGMAGTEYGRNAIDLDYSNSLRNLNKQQRARAYWVGKPPSSQIPYSQRD